MDIFRVVTSASGKILAFVKNHAELEIKVKSTLEDIRMEMDMMLPYIMTANQSAAKGNKTAGTACEKLTLHLQSLAYDMEDAIDLIDRKAKIPLLSLRGVRTLLTLDDRPQHILKMDGFLKRLAKLKQMQRDLLPTKDAVDDGASSRNAPACPTTRQFSAGRLVGIDGHKQELLDLLQEVEGQPKQLGVISIVGFRGVGKTTLARAVYDAARCCSVGEPFDCRAWVQVAPASQGSNHDAAANLLKETLRRLDPPLTLSTVTEAETSDDVVKALTKTLRAFLNDKR